MRMKLIDEIAHVKIFGSEDLLILLRSVKLDDDSVVNVEHLRVVSELVAGLSNHIELCESFLEVIKLKLQSGILVVSLLVNCTG